MKSGKSRIRREELSPALFPFLAVMVCTIGALVFILTIAVSQASQAAKVEIESAQEQIQAKEDLVALGTEEMLAQRTAFQDEIDRSRAALQHLDEHIDRLQTEAAQLQAEADAIKAAAQNDGNAKLDRQAELASLQANVAKLEAEIKDKIDSKKTARPAFSIVPYDGPNGTSRRPIYLECVAAGVIIQPENKLLTLADLRPPHGPGNPLDAALRAVRSSLQSYDGSSYVATPYPLLLVRPDGITSYALARAAMSAWDDQNGYELIDADMKLAFPESQPGLSAELDRVLAAARKRQVELIAGMPRSFSGSSQWDTEPTDLAVERGDEPASFGIGKHRDLGSGERFIEGSMGDKWGSEPPSGPGGMQTESGSGNSAGSSEYGSPTGGGETETGYAANSTGSASGAAQNSGSRGSQQGSNSALQGSQANSQQASAGGGGASQAGGQAIEQIDPKTQTELLKNVANDTTQPNATIKKKSGETSDQKSSKIADNLGAGWAVQRKQLSSTPVQRQIDITVLPDRWLIVTSNSRSRVEKVILLQNGPARCASDLSESVKDRISEWGIAVSGGYWVPVVNVTAKQDSQWAVDQLSTMLEDSGVEIQMAK